jgi:hypothetical protein
MYLLRTQNDVTTARAKQREWNALMAKYPSRAEGEPVVEILRQLPPRAIAKLGRISQGAVRDGHSVRYRPPDGQMGEDLKRLVETGLLEEVLETTKRGATSVWYKLTPTGIIAARMLRGRGKPPEWAADMA